MENYKIRVFGWGLVGSEAVGLMAKSFQSNEYVSVEFMVADYNSDIRKYSADNVKARVLGASYSPADYELKEISEFFDGANFAYICTGMGEANSSRIVSAVSEIAKESGAFTICAYTMPFVFESSEKVKAAEEQREKLMDKVDAMVEVPKPSNMRGMGITQVFEIIDERFREIVQMTPDLCDGEYYMCADIDNFRAVLRGVQNARFITETVCDENKFQALAEKLSEIIPENTKRAVVHFSCANDITVSEFNDLYDSLNKVLDENAKAVTSVSLIPEDRISVSIIAAD